MISGVREGKKIVIIQEVIKSFHQHSWSTEYMPDADLAGAGVVGIKQ